MFLPSRSWRLSGSRKARKILCCCISENGSWILPYCFPRSSPRGIGSKERGLVWETESRDLYLAPQVKVGEKQVLKWPPIILTSWRSCPCGNPSSWLCVGNIDSCLMNRIWRKQRDATSKVRLQKDLLLFWALSLSEASCHVVSSPMERSTWQRTDASSQRSARTWGPHSVNEVGSRGFCSPSWHLDCRFLGDPELEVPG